MTQVSDNDTGKECSHTADPVMRLILYRRSTEQVLVRSES